MKNIKKFTAIIIAAIASMSLIVFAACGAKTVAVESVALNQTEITLEIGEEQTLIATVTPDDATDKTVVWSSSDNSVATVSDGKITAVAEGTATVAAKAGEKSATCSVTVNKAAPKQLTEAEWKAAFEFLRNSDNFIVNTDELEDNVWTRLLTYEIDGNKIKETWYEDDVYYEAYDEDTKLLTCYRYSEENGWTSWIYTRDEPEWIIDEETQEETIIHKYITVEFESLFDVLMDYLEYGDLGLFEYEFSGSTADGKNITGEMEDLYSYFTYDAEYDSYSAVYKESSDYSIYFSDGKISRVTYINEYQSLNCTFTYGTASVTLPEVE